VNLLSILPAILLGLVFQARTAAVAKPAGHGMAGHGMAWHGMAWSASAAHSPVSIQSRFLEWSVRSPRPARSQNHARVASAVRIRPPGAVWPQLRAVAGRPVRVGAQVGPSHVYSCCMRIGSGVERDTKGGDVNRRGGRRWRRAAKFCGDSPLLHCRHGHLILWAARKVRRPPRAPLSPTQCHSVPNLSLRPSRAEPGPAAPFTSLHGHLQTAGRLAEGLSDAFASDTPT
jgi:hypothetical protein